MFALVYRMLPTFKPIRLCFSSEWSIALCASKSFSTHSFITVGTIIVGGAILYKPRVATYIGRPPCRITSKMKKWNLHNTWPKYNLADWCITTSIRQTEQNSHQPPFARLNQGRNLLDSTLHQEQKVKRIFFCFLLTMSNNHTTLNLQRISPLEILSTY